MANKEGEVFKGLLVLASVVLISQPATAEEMLYSNSRYDFTCCSTISDLDYPLQIADGFVVGGGGTYTVTRVYWTGQYFGGSTPDADDFTIRFYGDAAGRPEVSPLISIHAGSSASRLDWGAQRYTYSLDIARLTLQAGEQYYLSILADTSGWDADWNWYAVDFPAGASRFDRVADSDQWEGNGLRDYIFRLFGDPPLPAAVPEPTSLALLLAACVAAVVVRRRRSA